MLQALLWLSTVWSCKLRCLFECVKSDNIFNTALIRVKPTPNNGDEELVKLRKRKGILKLDNYSKCQKLEDLKFHLSSEILRKLFMIERFRSNVFFDKKWKIKILLRRKANSARPQVFFQFQKVNYYYEEDIQQFKTRFYELDRKLEYYASQRGIESESHLMETHEQFDDNKMVMELPEFKVLFLERATAPFFVFQERIKNRQST